MSTENLVRISGHLTALAGRLTNLVGAELASPNLAGGVAAIGGANDPTSTNTPAIIARINAAVVRINALVTDFNAGTVSEADFHTRVKHIRDSINTAYTNLHALNPHADRNTAENVLNPIKEALDTHEFDARNDAPMQLWLKRRASPNDLKADSDKRLERNNILFDIAVPVVLGVAGGLSGLLFGQGGLNPGFACLIGIGIGFAIGALQRLWSSIQQDKKTIGSQDEFGSIAQKAMAAIFIGTGGLLAVMGGGALAHGATAHSIFESGKGLINNMNFGAGSAATGLMLMLAVGILAYAFKVCYQDKQITSPATPQPAQTVYTPNIAL